jgi:aryl-alcohol dehydrogenase-like predicted oxidoreductase
MQDNGLINIHGSRSFDETVEKLKGILQAKGITLFALIDHSEEAQKVGMNIHPTKLLIFGNPKAGTPVMLATKVRLPMSDNFNRSGATRVNIMREIEDSLRRLQTDYIDLYQVHGWDSNTPLEETLRTLDDLVRQGKVRYIGLSNLMSWQAATAVMLQERLGLERYVTAQMYYSLVGRGLEHEFHTVAERARHSWVTP